MTPTPSHPEAFSPTFSWELPQGLCVGLRLWDEPVAPNAALQQLSIEERQFALKLPSPRQKYWVGGRLALRKALEGVAEPFHLLPNARNAPVLPEGFEGSISHKATWAVAWAAPAVDGWKLGVDIERIEAPRIDIQERVLTKREIAGLTDLPEAQQTARLMTLFSAKEALYKAVDPFVQRYVGFQEVEIEFDAQSRMEARFSLPEGDFETQISCRALEDFVVTFARVRPLSRESF